MTNSPLPQAEAAVEARARELWASQFEAVGQLDLAAAIRSYRQDGPRSRTSHFATGLAAIKAALSTPADPGGGDVAGMIERLRKALVPFLFVAKSIPKHMHGGRYIEALIGLVPGELDALPKIGDQPVHSVKINLSLDGLNVDHFRALVEAADMLAHPAPVAIREQTLREAAAVVPSVPREPTEAMIEAVRVAIFGYHNNEADFRRLSPSQQDDWRRMARAGAMAAVARRKPAAPDPASDEGGRV